MSAPGPRSVVMEHSPRTAAHHYRRDQAHPSPLQSGVERARRCLLGKQRADGHWCAELQGDTILESEYVLLMAFLGRELDEKCVQAARYILTQQNADGGWSIYPGGPVDVGDTVKAYFALKLTGHSPDAPYMRAARAAILARGGAMKSNSFTKFYLALLGQLAYDNCPAVPPELIFLPRWAYINLYAMSSWTRTIVVPLSIFYAHKPVRQLPAELGIRELFLEDPHRATWTHPPTRRWLTWHNFFLAVDQLLKVCDPRRSSYPPESAPQGLLANVRAFLKQPFAWLRGHAVRQSTAWLFEHFADSDGVGAIFPPMVYTVICLRCLGYADDSPEMRWALRQLDDLMIEEDGTVRLQPCFSPVWDTALALNALACAPSPDQRDAVAQAATWLLDREVRRPGDWSLMNPGLEPGGWVFEYRNGFYPDTDDTAMVLMGLARTGHAHAGPRGEREPTAAAARAVEWLLGMQNSDGGWAAFDRDINHAVLEKVPFADHNAMLDPSCPDITARVLEALAEFGHRVGQPHVDRAIRFIQKTQDPRGCWIGRWGVNYLYGTWQVLQGLRAVGFDMRHPMVRRAVDWLNAVQQPCGGWGETCASYDDPALAGQGEPTASQTGWALLGLLAAGEEHGAAVRAGVRYLLGTQQPDGGWVEEQFTGTGFPKVFYLKYHYYCLYFPLMALAKYQQLTGTPVPPHVPHRSRAEAALELVQ